MDIRQLRLFCRIVERRSFSLAAQDLHITQPAASQQVAASSVSSRRPCSTGRAGRIAPTEPARCCTATRARSSTLQERACHRDPRPRRARRRQDRRWARHRPRGAHPAGAAHRFQAAVSRRQVILYVDDTQQVMDRVVSREFELGSVGAPAHRPDLVIAPLVKRRGRPRVQCQAPLGATRQRHPGRARSRTADRATAGRRPAHGGRRTLAGRRPAPGTDQPRRWRSA